MGEISLASRLQTAHKHLEDVLLQSSVEDAALAEKLEKFLNFVVYKKMPPSNTFDTVLTRAMAEELQKDTRLIHLFTMGGKGVGKRGEKAFAEIILQIANLIDPKALKYSVSTSIKKAIIGNVSATVAAQEISQKHAQQLSQKLKGKQSIREFTSWNAKQGKIDVDTSQVEIVGAPTGLAKQLLNMTASVKNYTSFRIHLENVDRNKAYLAIMSETYPKLTKESLESLQFQFKNMENGEIVEEHLTHLIKLYALTGYGQAYINRTKEILERKYARFLMVNNRAAQEIKIRSTLAIARDEIFGTGASGFITRKTSKGKYETVYNI